MATRKVLLAKDVTGLKPENYIQGEGVDIGIGRDRLIRPEYGAFFEEGLELFDLDGNKIDRTKYVVCDLYEEATKKSGKAVWNAIVVTDQSVPSQLSIFYHGYGGRFAVNGRILVEWLNEKLATVVDPIEWLELSDRPHKYNPAYHKHLWDEVYGWSYIKRPLTNIENAIRLDTSYFYQMLIKDIQRKLEEANRRAMELANFYATKAVSDATINISKEKLGIHLLANFTTSVPAEMRAIAKEDFDSATIIDDRYINKKGLIAFMDEVHKRSVKISETNLGTTEVFLREPRKGSLISLGNAGIATFDSKSELVRQGIYYEENIFPKNYPDNDRYTVLRITHNLNDHGGLFLGFNNTTGEMFSGTLKDDRCFMRIKWYKFYSDLTYNSIKQALADHVKATNNPHKLRKDQVGLSNVKNLPVVTLEEIMKGDPKDSYMTLDGLQVLLASKLLDLKPEFKEDGSLNRDSDLFNKPNLIFTPCDKKVPDNWPPEGMLLKTYCDGSDRFRRVADGKGGFKDEILQLDSDDCKYFEIRPQGEVLYKVCKEVDQWSVVADGRGGTTEVLSAVNSLECGYKPPPEAGTLLGEGCEGENKIRKYADGVGGVTQVTIEVNSPDCGYTTTTTTTLKPVGKKIVLYSTHQKIEPGSNETFTVYFTGFEPGIIGFVLQAKEPLGTVAGGAFKDFVDQVDGTAQIDTSGSGSWTFNQLDDGVTVPRNTQWTSRILAEDGTTSNNIVRSFVGTGGGGEVINPPPPPPPPPAPGPGPGGLTPQVCIEPASSWRVDGMRLNESNFVFTINGGSPNTNYYFRFMQRLDPVMPGKPDNMNYKEIYNGILSTNSAGQAKMQGTHQVLFGHLLGAGPGHENTVNIFGHSYGYLVLEDGTRSNEVKMSNTLNATGA